MKGNTYASSQTDVSYCQRINAKDDVCEMDSTNYSDWNRYTKQHTPPSWNNLAKDIQEETVPYPNLHNVLPFMLEEHSVLQPYSIANCEIPCQDTFNNLTKRKCLINSELRNLQNKIAE